MKINKFGELKIQTTQRSNEESIINMTIKNLTQRSNLTGFSSDTNRTDFSD